MTSSPLLIPWIVILIGLVATPLAAQPADGEGNDFFERVIRPVLVDRCYECHSAESTKVKGGLLLDTRDGLRQGGSSGKAGVVPGRPAESLLMTAIRYRDENLQMPPKRKLTEEQIAQFEAWIQMGAPDPRTGSAESKPKKPAAKGPHWAFVPPRASPLPTVRGNRWIRNPVDRFILAGLEAKGLSPAPRADARTLIRRATFDLHGLPPSPEEVESFVRDRKPGAYERVIERLLGSPRYGERWGRHWLDVARYADTKGYVYDDREDRRYVHAYPYRDWVIRAFNEDMPYDRFVQLQVAADLLGGDRRDLAAMGYLTLGRRFLGVTHDIIDDRIDVLSRGLQGLTVACARCHDHKFDPISTRDYYSLYGVFDSSTDRLVPMARDDPPSQARLEFEKGLAERTAKFDEAYQKAREEVAARIRKRTADYLLAQLTVQQLPSEEFYEILDAEAVNPIFVRRWQAYLRETARAFDPIFAPWHALASLSAEEFRTKAPMVWASLKASSGVKVNPLVVEAIDRLPLGSMEEVVRAYGTLFNAALETPRAESSSPSSPREERVGGGSRGGEVNENGPPLPAPLLHPMEERERMRSLMYPCETPVAAAGAPLSAAGSDAPSAPGLVVTEGLTGAWESLRQVLSASNAPVFPPVGSLADTHFYFDESARVNLGKLFKDIEVWHLTAQGAAPYAGILQDLPEARTPRVFRRGNPGNRGEEVPRQFLEVIAGPGRKPFQHGSGRLELARAIASRDNPLTARVMVNRVWMHHFGSGIVGTPSDFGLRCEPPSHPELLDHLALWFMDQGWSVKQLHRLIMTSATYQQSADGPVHRSERAVAGRVVGARQSAETHDPQNRLLSHFNRRRLDFESLRDSLLVVSGDMDPALGGRSADLFKAPFSRRRTVYGTIDRVVMPGTLRAFDFANPDLHIPQRHETTVPQQALFLLNSPFVVERARSWVERLPEGDARERVRRLYASAYQRSPTTQELKQALAFVDSVRRDPPPRPAVPKPSAWSYGYGELDPVGGRVSGFVSFPHFTGDSWQGGPAWPDSALGWLRLTAEGGHPGEGLARAVVRRWTAPMDGLVKVGGTAVHEAEPGDGIRATLVHSARGAITNWPAVHHTKAETVVESVSIMRGEWLDFVVDCQGTISHDDFKWAPTVRFVPGPALAAGEGIEWNARKDFAGREAPPVPLDPWSALAQVLFLSNEFAYVD